MQQPPLSDLAIDADWLARSYRLACSLSGDAHDAEDAVQQAALRLLQSESEPSLAAFLALTRYSCLDQQRAEGRRRRRQDLAAGGGRSPVVESDPLVEAELAEHLRQALAELDERYRTPVLLRCLEDMSFPAIAITLALPEKTVDSRVRRGLQRLRRLLRRRGLSVDSAALLIALSGQRAEAWWPTPRQLLMQHFEQSSATPLSAAASTASGSLTSSTIWMSLLGGTSMLSLIAALILHQAPNTPAAAQAPPPTVSVEQSPEAIQALLSTSVRCRFSQADLYQACAVLQDSLAYGQQLPLQIFIAHPRSLELDRIDFFNLHRVPVDAVLDHICTGTGLQRMRQGDRLALLRQLPEARRNILSQRFRQASLPWPERGEAARMLAEAGDLVALRWIFENGMQDDAPLLNLRREVWQWMRPDNRFSQQANWSPLTAFAPDDPSWAFLDEHVADQHEYLQVAALMGRRSAVELLWRRYHQTGAMTPEEWRSQMPTEEALRASYHRTGGHLHRYDWLSNNLPGALLDLIPADNPWHRAAAAAAWQQISELRYPTAAIRQAARLRLPAFSAQWQQVWNEAQQALPTVADHQQQPDVLMELLKGLARIDGRAAVEQAAVLGEAIASLGDQHHLAAQVIALLGELDLPASSRLLHGLLHDPRLQDWRGHVARAMWQHWNHEAMSFFEAPDAIDELRCIVHSRLAEHDEHEGRRLLHHAWHKNLPQLPYVTEGFLVLVPSTPPANGYQPQLPLAADWLQQELLGKLRDGTMHERCIALHLSRGLSHPAIQTAMLDVLLQDTNSFVRSHAAAVIERGNRHVDDRLLAGLADPGTSIEVLIAILRTSGMPQDPDAWFARLQALRTHRSASIRAMVAIDAAQVAWADYHRLRPQAAVMIDAYAADPALFAEQIIKRASELISEEPTRPEKLRPFFFHNPTVTLQTANSQTISWEILLLEDHQRLDREVAETDTF